MLQPLTLWAADTVLFPATEALLHPRQPAEQAFFRAAFQQQTTFGVLWQAKASRLARAGVLAQAVALKEYRDGRMEVDIVGMQRFKLQELLTAQPTLQGRVALLPEHADTAAADNVVVQARRLLERYLLLVQDVDPVLGRDMPADVALAVWPFQAANQLALGHQVRQELLELDSHKARMIKIIEALRQEIAHLDFLTHHSQPPRRAQLRLN